jgi:hypothetical protein
MSTTSRDEQAGLNGHTLGGEPAASVHAVPLDSLLGTRHAAPAPKPHAYIGIDRIENGFIIRAHAARMADDFATRVAYSPAEAGAAVAELLKRHMSAEDLKGAPDFAVLRYERASFATPWIAPDAAPKAATPAKPKAAKAAAGVKLPRATAAGLMAKRAAKATKKPTPKA